MFVDDCVLYTDSTDQADSTRLQDELNHTDIWCKNNDMVLNTNKCVHISFTKRVNRSMSQYTLKNQVIRKKTNTSIWVLCFLRMGDDLNTLAPL